MLRKHVNAIFTIGQPMHLHKGFICLPQYKEAQARKSAVQPRGVKWIVGRRRTSKEVRDLIFRMVAENSTWGAPRVHGELFMLGFDVSERTISRWMKRAPRDPGPAKRCLAFLRNHREAIAAMDLELTRTLGRINGDVQKAATIGDSYAVPDENNLPVYICRNPRIPLSQAWPWLKFFG